MDDDLNDTTQLAAETLKELTLLCKKGNKRRGNPNNKEGHPKAVLSTKQKSDEATPVSSSPRSLSAQVVTSPRCTVSRQPSTPVDLVFPSPAPGEGTSHHTETSSLTRPAGLNLNRELSSNSGGSGVATPCERIRSPRCSRSIADDRHLGSSYPPYPGLHCDLQENTQEDRASQLLCLVSYLDRNCGMAKRQAASVNVSWHALVALLT